MPFYDYECAECGSFSTLAPMARAAEPAPCPGCGSAGERVILSAPFVAGMDPMRRNAMATNERSRHEPARSSGRHPAGCGCCGDKSRAKAGKAVHTAGGAKTFPSARPWMISH